MKKIQPDLLFLTAWRDFLKHYGKHILFIALFYSLEACYSYIGNCDLSLHGFPGRMIGIATLKGIDIAKRTALFYNSVFLFLIINLAFYVLAFIGFRKRLSDLKELKLLNYLSLAGCLLLFLGVFKLNSADGIHLIILLQGSAFIFLMVKRFLLDSSHRKIFNSALFSMIICGSVCLFFLLKEITFLFHINIPIYTSVSILLLSFLSSVALAVYIRKLPYTEVIFKTIKLAWVIVPLLLLPLLTFLKNEVYLILNSKGIIYFTALKLYCLFLLLSAVWVYVRSRRSPEKLRHWSLYKILSNVYFPLLLLGITVYIYYEPFYMDDSREMFEEANRLLPVMEFLKFHTVPLLEKFNSHMLSEIATIYLYAVFNKLSGLQPLLYDFIFPVGGAMVSYFILKDLTRNSYVALFTVVLFPLAKDLAVMFFPALLVVYILYMVVYRPPSVKNYVALFFTCLFLILWKIDLGVAGDISIAGILILYSVSKIMLVNLRYLVQAFAIFAGSLLLLFLLFWIKGINLIGTLLNELNYLSSVQSYGYTVLSYSPPDKVFQMQYFIFPVVALLLGAYIVLQLTLFSKSNKSSFATLCILFCIGFYLANFQRGLVRHSFAENIDEFLSSFIFFILSACVYLLFKQRSQVAKFLFFFFVSFLLLTGFKYPASHPFVVYETLKSRLKTFSEITPKPFIDREIDTAGFQHNFGEFRNFVSDNLKNDETFIDFSNQPMLYYYTHKITPAYFFQSPYSMHNDYLQKRFLENLSNYKTPLLVFATALPFPASFWDNPDNVPNGLRHYRMAEYFYREYEPFAIVQNLSLWKKKSSLLQNSVTRLYYKDFVPAAYPDSAFKKQPVDSILVSDNNNILFTVTSSTGTARYAGLSYRYGTDPAIHTLEPIFSDSSSHKVYFLLSPTKAGNLMFYIGHFSTISSMQADGIQYLPDYYSTVPQYWELDMLPYIWANYDGKIGSDTVLQIISTKDTLVNKSPVFFDLPATIDKSTGNYIRISFKANNTAPVPVQFSYGPLNGGMNFSIPPGDGTRVFAIRISAQYNWYAKKNTKIRVFAPCNQDVRLEKILLLKGD